MEGDNIYGSTDSRNFGPVPYGLLQGRVFWRVRIFSSCSSFFVIYVHTFSCIDFGFTPLA